MSKGIDYSKWDNIQLSSDDDEDCHPNIEKFTWRRLRQVGYVLLKSFCYFNLEIFLMLLVKRQRDDEEAKRKVKEAQLKVINRLFLITMHS